MYKQAELEAKTGPELVAIFNGINGTQPVKRFTNREVGVRRIIAATSHPVAPPAELVNLLSLGGTVLSPAPNPKFDEKPKTKSPKAEEAPKKERGIYDEPRKELIRIFRPNSRRGRLITLLLNEGATFDELLANKEVGFNTEDVLHKTIRILNWWTGYGLATDENGTITLTD